MRLLRDEFLFLREAPQQLNNYLFTGRIAAEQSRSIELRNKDSPLADVEKCAERGVAVNHAGDRDKVVGLLDHAAHVSRIARNFAP